MMDLNKFGEIMDKFLEKEEVAMLIKLPEGTLEAEIEDNIGAGSVVQFYFLLQAFEAIGKQMRKDMELEGPEDWKKIVNSLTEILKTDLMEVE